MKTEMKPFEWKKSDPESQNITSASILRFLRRVEDDELELHGLMIVRNGYVVAEASWSPYRADMPHVLNSLSKSFTATAIGLAAEEGRLSLDDRVISYFPEEVTPEIADNMNDLRIRHLLTMSTGHTTDPIPIMESATDGNWAGAFLRTPIERPPGTHFLYNTGASYMLSAILHRATGELLLDYLRPRLFEPLGITDVMTKTCPRGIHAGGFGMYLKLADIARFGQLYLQEGVWEGRQILPADWVKAATEKQMDNGNDPSSDWAQGYGYQFWRCRNGAYRGDGAFGQFCIVIPRKQAVIAMTSGTMDMQGILDAVWEELLPGMADEPVGEPVAATREALAARLRSSGYPAAAVGKKTNPGQWAGQTYQVAANPAGIRTLKFMFGDGASSLMIEDGDGVQEIRIGHGEWTVNEVRIGGESAPAAVCGRWVKRDAYEIEIRFLNQAYHDRWTCRFMNDSLQLSTVRNVHSELLLMPTLNAVIHHDRDMRIGGTDANRQK